MNEVVQEKVLINDETSIFKFINPLDNNKLSELSGEDLQELIVLLDEYYIQLRKKLGFEQNITFGLELEFENSMRKRVEEIIEKKLHNGFWKVKGDGSLKKGVEINSPILRDNESSWNNLDKVCNIIEPFVEVGQNCGGHIHIGTQVLGDESESWLNFIKLWSIYENIIFRFAYGDFLTARPSLNKFAFPVAKSFFIIYEESKEYNSMVYEILGKLSIDRYQAVNFSNVLGKNCKEFSPNNTIEFRCPNASLNSAIWQNNVNFFVKMLKYCNSDNFNDDIVSKRRELNLDNFSNLYFYDEIYLEQALELCDMIFTNNLDKIYFLKQYLKSYQVCNKRNSYPKAQVLTKKGINKDY